MFIDYLRLSYFLPLDKEEKRKTGEAVARGIADRIKVCGEVKVDGSHKQQVRHTRLGTWVILDWGGSTLPLDLTEFLKRFRKYAGWKISRLDLAENIEHVTKEMVRPGQAKTIQEFHENISTPSGNMAKVWTGTSIGRRGRAGSFFRVYDARKHVDGHAAKISRFGHYEFWRVEYELSREYFRRKGIHTVDQLTVELLESMWSSETYKKGVWIDGTSEYQQINLGTIEEVEEDMAHDNRVLMIERMARKLDLVRLVAVADLVDRLLREAKEKEKKRK